MRRRVLLSGLVGCCVAGLFPGCVPAQVVNDPGPVTAPTSLPTTLVAQAPLPPDNPDALPTVSPYHAQTAGPDAPPSKPGPPRVEQAPLPIATDSRGSATQVAVDPVVLPQIINGPQAPTPESCVLQALRAMQDRRPEDDVRRCLAKLDPSIQEMVLRLLALSNRLGEHGTNQVVNAQDMAKYLDQVDAVSGYLRARAPLVLPTVCLCRKIKNFGVYDPIANPVFQGGGDGKQPGELVQVYVEVRNFGQRKTGRQFYETALACRLTIHPCPPPKLASLMSPESNPGGSAAEPLFCKDLGTWWERSLTPRQDYFICVQFHVPANLTPGRYVLAVEVRDDIGIDLSTGKARAAAKTVEFQVVSPGAPFPANGG